MGDRTNNIIVQPLTVVVLSKIERKGGEYIEMNKFGVVVKAMRVRMGWTQEELAERLHMSRTAIGKIENDQQTLDVPTLVQLAQITNAPEIAIAIIYGMDGIQILQNLLGMFGLILLKLF